MQTLNQNVHIHISLPFMYPVIQQEPDQRHEAARLGALAAGSIFVIGRHVAPRLGTRRAGARWTGVYPRAQPQVIN